MRPWLKRSLWIVGYLSALAVLLGAFFILLLFYSLGRHSNLFIEIALSVGSIAAAVGFLALCFQYKTVGRAAYALAIVTALVLFGNMLWIGHQVNKRFAEAAFDQNKNLLADAIDILPCTDNSVVVLAPVYPPLPAYEGALALYLIPENKKKSYHIIDSTLTLPKIPFEQKLPLCSSARYPTLQHALDDLASRKGTPPHDR